MVPLTKKDKVFSCCTIEYLLENLLQMGRGGGGANKLVFGGEKKRFIVVIPYKFVKKKISYVYIYIFIMIFLL